jgi:UDP-GlcNAc:undecaprenyl-phosphate GlcNAc-1-phosphate transferase
MQFLPVALSFLIGLLAVHLVRRLSFRLGKVKQPRQDRWSRKPTPTLGGVGIFVAFWGAIVVNIILTRSFSTDYLGLLLGICLAFAVGLIDDLHPLSPPIKMGGQLLAATVVIFFGDHTIKFFPWPIANILLTYLWLIGITN